MFCQTLQVFVELKPKMGFEKHSVFTVLIREPEEFPVRLKAFLSGSKLLTHKIMFLSSSICLP